MSRASYCREQAQVCRDLASQMSDRTAGARLREMARAYEAEASALEGSVQQQQQQQQQQQSGK
jgi:hypothetical protein